MKFLLLEHVALLERQKAPVKGHVIEALSSGGKGIWFRS
jgi:hypothetical protein